ncbi:MarR family winged helix-turn-helix transcriptional regulator [uncultured Gemella sp.]|uniref:MarR family winged helix-turn-helix transcriptional regulator n=1 Tax=uncultured Gemella sp. TaxID=254352 RepID=UPI0028D4021F|nr:MarR family winged helix-turn-helix transcriptional regulator [uncultured Gemella sp.]
MNNEFKVVIGIMRASNLLIDDLKKTLKNYPVNVTEFAVMEFLYSKGEKSIQEIRDRILLASGSATYVVDNLEKKGYVNRKISQKDKRVTYIKLTEVGKKLMDDIFPIHKINTKMIFDDLTKDELVTLKEILKKIN